MNEVTVPNQTDGTWTVVDLDNIESDPAREWSPFDAEDKAYIRANYAEDYARFFAQLEGLDEKLK